MPDVVRRALDEPEISPGNRDIVPSDYDHLGGRGSSQEFFNEFGNPSPTGPYDNWRWPDNQGAAPGSQDIVPTPPGMPMDRIGFENGEYFSPPGTPFGQRSLPPDRLAFPRNDWSVDADAHALRDGSVRMERSQIAPAFGQPGGGTQYRFLDPDGNPLSQARLRELGVIVGG